MLIVFLPRFASQELTQDWTFPESGVKEEAYSFVPEIQSYRWEIRKRDGEDLTVGQVTTVLRCVGDVTKCGAIVTPSWLGHQSQRHL